MGEAVEGESLVGVLVRLRAVGGFWGLGEEGVEAAGWVEIWDAVRSARAVSDEGDVSLIHGYGGFGVHTSINILPMCLFFYIARFESGGILLDPVCHDFV